MRPAWPRRGGDRRRQDPRGDGGLCAAHAPGREKQEEGGVASRNPTNATGLAVNAPCTGDKDPCDATRGISSRGLCASVFRLLS